MTPTSIVAYLVLFVGGAFVFLLISLSLGRLLRAQVPTPEKLRSYECGEPAVGTSEVQFDLRFYVMALVFLIFDVEVAFFPWAVVFGTANQVAQLAATAAQAPPATAGPLVKRLNEDYGKLGAQQAQGKAESPAAIRATARSLAFFSLVDLGVFFVVLLVGFAYVWSQGDLDWARAFRGGGPEAVATAGPLEVVA